jgi:DNA mismatch repair protein MutL
MNTRIHILPENIASKIAAGEVIQRPASVVKEAIENSIDAGATKIVVSIKESGSAFIQIADNGTGIEPEELAVAFERHATSKISTYDDLENIRTLGFRGEALASIAAVAQVEIRTRVKTESVGMSLRVEGGERYKPEPFAMEPGSTLTVKNLFFNTPARRNFLKSSATEFKHILDTVQRAALSRPDIAFTFVSDDDMVFDVMPGDLKNRIAKLFGDDLGEGLMECAEETEYLTVFGFLAKPEYSRRTRNDQYLFLNKRYITNRSINHAVYRAYEHLMIKGSFPFYVLFLDIDPHRIDVNIHPSKLEAKFDDERSVYGIITSVVRKTLAQHDMVPSYESISPNARNEFGTNLGMRPKTPLHMLKVNPDTGEIVEESTDAAESRGLSLFRGRHDTDERYQTGKAQSPEEIGKEPDPKTDAGVETGWIYQLQNKYILTHIRSGLMIIDQHVAHERILYERALKRFNEPGPASQQLLFPETIELDRADAMLVKEILPLLERLGFDIKIFGSNTVVLEGIPSDVRPSYEHDILQRVLSEYRDNHNTRVDARDILAKSFACKAAVKSGDSLNETEMRILIDQLFATEMPYVCPHGRPVVIKLTIEELDKKFGRT